MCESLDADAQIQLNRTKKGILHSSLSSTTSDYFSLSSLEERHVYSPSSHSKQFLIQPFCSSVISPKTGETFHQNVRENAENRSTSIKTVASNTVTFPINFTLMNPLICRPLPKYHILTFLNGDGMQRLLNVLSR